MKQFFSKYFEYLLLGNTILMVFLKPMLPTYGERMSMILFGTLSFYYLASGILVFLDKQRIGRIMRLIYLFGLWSVSITVMAVMARTLLLQMDKQLLIISVSSGVGLMAYLFLYYRKLEADDKATLLIWIKPLVLRSILALCIAIAFFISSNYGIYSLFGTHKNDPVYTEKAVNAYENPDDTAAVNDLNRYDALLDEKEEKPAE
ncbi:MAG: hypothetical protein WBP31_07215 [Chitinophagales bacterium]|nr:hypothetical protein [Bacteroidota bacterium]MBL0278781.1 hypothetical protein [Bacteroidota bacterium]MBP9880077.1 hypothetical protein [Chitinophagales bacterium]